MNQADVLAHLRPLEPILRQQGLAALYLFGSVARNEANDGSDIDLLFDVITGHKFSVFDQVRVQSDLSDALSVKVDFIAVEGLRPAMRARIEPDMVKVF